MLPLEMLPNENETSHERRTLRLTHALKTQGQMIITETKQTKNLQPLLLQFAVCFPSF